MERDEKRVVDTYRQGPAGKEQPELDGLRGGREAEEKAKHENGGRGRLPKTTDGPREPGPSSSRAGCRKRASDSTTGAWGPLTSRDPVLLPQQPGSFIFPFISSPRIQQIFTKHLL